MRSPSCQYVIAVGEVVQRTTPGVELLALLEFGAGLGGHPLHEHALPCWNSSSAAALSSAGGEAGRHTNHERRGEAHAIVANSSFLNIEINGDIRTKPRYQCGKG